ncbi:MAG: NAD-dependent deacylase [Rubrivivax sp.]|nr:NAD-dependent deacylase [Rubrivivax sp.]
MENIERWRGALAQARRVCVLTGAGMSAESGVPTFRDALTGLWARFDPVQLASEQGFRADPRQVWDWYAERRDGVRRAEPNAGHRALALFAARRPGVLTLVTQNVDDLHQRAGMVDTVRLHGDLLQDRWLDRCAQRPACDPASAQPGRPPRCERCANLVRPGVVWFGESLPAKAYQRAEQAAQACQLMLVVGTSGAVWPAAGLAVLARTAGAKVLIVNPQPSEIDHEAHGLLRGSAASVLPSLLDAWPLH